jgi:hypothetical protein
MTKLPTWGYRSGKARVFELAPGEALPKGWADTMPRGEHPHEVERSASPASPLVPSPLAGEGSSEVPR